MSYTSPNPLYSYPGFPAWVPSTSLMTLPMGGLGATGAGGLGASRLMGPTEVLHVGKLYTYRTYSLVPLVEGAEFGGFFSRNTAWGNHRSTLDILQPPGTVRSLYQAGTAEPYTGSGAPSYRGRNVYVTSLTFTPKRAGLTVAQAKSAALNILNAMRANFADDQSMKIFEGNLYERGVSDTIVEAPSILDRARAVITGQDPADAVRERVAEAQASDQRMLYFKIGAVMTFALGLFLATRKGSAKLEGRAFTAATLAAPLVRRNGRKRRAPKGSRRHLQTVMSREGLPVRVDMRKLTAQERRQIKRLGYIG